MADTKTRAELVERALKNLGVLPSGQAANAEDTEAVDALVDPLLESLNARDIVYVEDADEIPMEWFAPLGECLAFAASPEFGASIDPARLNKLGRPKAEDDLRLMTAERPRYRVLEGEYF